MKKSKMMRMSLKRLNSPPTKKYKPNLVKLIQNNKMRTKKVNKGKFKRLQTAIKAVKSRLKHQRQTITFKITKLKSKSITFLKFLISSYF